MTAHYAYCPGCRKENLGSSSGNAIVVASPSHLEIVKNFTQIGQESKLGNISYLRLQVRFRHLSEQF